MSANIDRVPVEQLLSTLLGMPRTGDEPDVAASLLACSGGLAQLSRASPRELLRIARIGRVRAARLIAAFELGRRAIEDVARRTPIAAPDDVYRLMAPRVAGLQQETFWTLGLDVRNGLVDLVEVGRGSVCGVEVHPREVFRPLIRMAAAAGVLVHNHPSGDPTPSDEDLELTERLRTVGTTLGIPIIDHVVIGQGSFRSIAEVAV